MLVVLEVRARDCISGRGSKQLHIHSNYTTWYRKSQGTIIYTVTDSNADIQPVRIVKTQSHCATGDRNALVSLAEQNRIVVQWIPVHLGIQGNEYVDLLRYA